MKIVCNCGNEIELKFNDEVDEDERGKYVTWDYSLMDAYAEHDEAGFTCCKCKESIWWFA